MTVDVTLGSLHPEKGSVAVNRAGRKIAFWIPTGPRPRKFGQIDEDFVCGADKEKWREKRRVFRGAVVRFGLMDGWGVNRCLYLVFVGFCYEGM